MRLLHVTSFALEERLGDSIPPYAILSHTWGPLEDEVLYSDVCNGLKPGTTEKPGWAKVQNSCQQACVDGYSYIWIDTCCIDKSSSAELSEAINSMWQWYQRAGICYAYLEDVALGTPKVFTDWSEVPEHVLNDGYTTEDITTDDGRTVKVVWLKDTAPVVRSFTKSRWFTRGWTLQELIAPRDVEFYSSSWVLIASRQRNKDYAQRIEEKTGIPLSILRRAACSCPQHRQRVTIPDLKCTSCGQRLNSLAILDSHSIAERMSWAAGRKTTRLEDRAYSLLGLFGVHMPLLYGEGDRAFLRLQDEIIKISDDDSILAFARKYENSQNHLLAESPDAFHKSDIALPPIRTRLVAPSMVWTSKYIQLKMLICPCTLRTARYDEHALKPEQHTDDSDATIIRFKRGHLGILSCGTKADPYIRPAILLELAGEGTSQTTFRRTASHILLRICPLSTDEITVDVEPEETFGPHSM